MKGEFDSPSKPASDAYRDGWERLFGKKVTSKDSTSQPTGSVPKV
jgi:hypothetical protein